MILIKFREYLEYLSSLNYDDETEVDFVEFDKDKLVYRQFILDEIVEEKIYSENDNRITVELIKEEK